MLNILWLVLAGFILGFATSSIWEWYYYRGKRLAQMRQESHESTAEPPADDKVGAQSARSIKDEIPPAPYSGAAPYKSEAVLLENERMDVSEPAPPTVGDWQTRQTMQETIDDLRTGARSVRAHAQGEEPLPARMKSDAEKAITPVHASEDPGSIQKPEEQAVISFRRGPVESKYRQHKIVKYDAVDEKPERQNETETDGENLSSAPTVQDSAPDELEDEEWLHNVAEARQPVVNSRKYVEARSSEEALSDADVGHATTADEYPDDLTRVRGIGKAYQKKLYGAGICTWHELSQTEEKRLREVTNAAHGIETAAWKDDAEKLAKESGRTGALYRGPRPDDLRTIAGITPTIQTFLYRAGVVTYQQLAETTPEELIEILPKISNLTPEYVRPWIQQAQEKQES